MLAELSAAATIVSLLSAVAGMAAAGASTVVIFRTRQKANALAIAEQQIRIEGLTRWQQLADRKLDVLRKGLDDDSPGRRFWPDDSGS